MFLLNDVEELYNKFSDKVYEENNLSKKTKELIAVACSIMADCVPCLNWHYTQALESGASKEEISEAIAIAMSVSSGSKRAKYSKVVDTITQDKA